MKQAIIRKLRETRGAAIALVALSMIALVSAVALAVDVGMLVTARTEAQQLGDAAALAGAAVLRSTAGDSAAAHDSAVAFGNTHNTVRGDNVVIQNGDVDVIPDEWTVRVRVHRTSARGTAVPTFFARVFGIDEVDVVTNAAAWAVSAGSAGGDPESSCLLPVALVDDFEDTNGNGVYDNGEIVNGYGPEDHGRLIKLKIHNNDPTTGPPACQTDATNPEVSNNIDYCQDGGDSSAWRCWWRESESAGGGNSVLGPRIYPANDCPEMALGDTVWAASASGNKQSLVANDDNDNNFQGLINSEPDLEWWPDGAGGNGCVRDNTVSPPECFTGNSGRIRSSPVVDPTIDGGGSHTYSVIDDFIGVFVEQVSCAYDAGPEGGPQGRWNVYVRLLVEGGNGGSSGDGGPDGESLVRELQLIE